MNNSFESLIENKQVVDQNYAFLYLYMNERMTYDELVHMGFEIDDLDRLYRNIETIESLRNKYSSDEAFEKVTKTTKGWELSDAMKGVLDKMVEYFVKFFSYVSKVLLLNVKAVKAELISHISKMSSKEYVAKVRGKNLTGPTIATVIQIANASEKLMKEEKNRISRLSALTRETDASKFNEARKLNDESLLETFHEVSEKIKTEDEDVDNGGWLDAGKLKDLERKLDPIATTIDSVVSLEKDAKTIIETIRSTREDDSPDLANLKKSLMNYLKTDLSKEFRNIINVLAKTINTTGKLLTTMTK